MVRLALYTGNSQWDAAHAYLVRVGHLPRTAQSAVVVAHTRAHGLDLGLLRVERVAVVVLLTANRVLRCDRISNKDCVCRTIDVGIDTQAEEVLVVVSVNARVDLSSPWSRRLAGVQRVCVQNTSQLDLKLDSTVLVENPVNAVLVVRCGEDVADQ